MLIWVMMKKLLQLLRIFRLYSIRQNGINEKKDLCAKMKTMLLVQTKHLILVGVMRQLNLPVEL